MANKKQETVETPIVETPVVVDETPVVETVDKYPGHNTRAFRG
jgi:hypothetical protein